MNERLRSIVTAAVFAAITTLATMIIKVPTFGTNGYVNIGDT
ncbi:MAG: ECF transporter S component, partial [Lachnospiraceae bacterium]|nr:ECF transporter S component [Lachnospiraceae bacterium]